MANNRFIYIILAAFISGMLLLIFIQYNSSRSIDQLIAGNTLLLNELKAGNDLREMERDILSVESKIRAAVATGDPSFADGIDEQIADAEAKLDTLRNSKDRESIADINRLAVLAREKLDKKNLMLDSFFHEGRMPDKTVIANPRAQGAANEINSIIRRLYAKRQARLATLSISVQKNGKIARTSGIILISLVLFSGSGLFWFIIVRIRRQNELIRRLDASERKLQDAVRIKENFMANMSHEIRTPLNSIIGFTGLLARQPMNEASREFVTAIGQSGENLLAIINDILDLSKIEAGMMRVESNPFSVRELFHSVDTLFHHRVLEKGLEFEVVVEDGVPDVLLGDATRLTQVLVNLIGNALKFTGDGGIRVNVSAIDIQDGAVQLWVEVRDTGIGIRPQQMATIFDRFSQAENSITRKYGGTGLGLAIVKDLIELQHGSIEVDSEPAKGTSFRFQIPYPIISRGAAPALQPAAPVAARLHPGNGRILVADDNKMNQRLMEHLLAEQGIPFDMVDDGQKVIDRLRQRAYQLVLMDIQMPVMDGYTASRLIREQLGSTVPIVAMTAHAMPGEREKCLASGMNDYLSKPIVEEQLFQVIGRFMEDGDGAGDVDDGRVGVRGSEVAGGGEVIVGGERAGASDAGYRFIDTAYLKELSGGDGIYEHEMTDQFLVAVPMDLDGLGSALSAGDLATVSQIVHNMKTTVSIMGMTERLYVLLDMLEYPDGLTDLSAVYVALKQVCGFALEEARRFRR